MIVTAISGASGPIMGIRLIEELLKMEEEVASVVSTSAVQIIKHELAYDMKPSSSLKPLLENRGVTTNLERLREYDNHNFFSPPASGSSEFEAVIVMPCSMKTLSAIANGYTDCLITRACDVALKEKRQCIIVPRETPLNLIHIENMKKAAAAGVIIAPPAPGFYTRPETIDDIIDFFVGKVLHLIGKKHTLFERWENMPEVIK